jgi:hypothetical protein
MHEILATFAAIEPRQSPDCKPSDEISGKVYQQERKQTYPLLQCTVATLIWPKLMAFSISIIQNADYLTPRQEGGFLYNNAARF